MRNPANNWKTWIVVAASLAVVLFFQNCASLSHTGGVESSTSLHANASNLSR